MPFALLIAFTSEMFNLLSRNTCIKEVLFGTVIVLLETAALFVDAEVAVIAGADVVAVEVGFAAGFC